MNIRNIPLLTFCIGGVVLSACVKQDVIKTAQDKELVVSGQTLTFGGTYNETKKTLQLMVNGDPIMKGTFSNFNPTQNLNANYKGLKISSYCYFGSVLGNKGGVFGMVAQSIQSSKSKAGDKCDISVNGESLESLYF